MPDQQGFALKEEILETLRDLSLPGVGGNPVDKGWVKKVVVCGGFVKIWLSQGTNIQDAQVMESCLQGRPGVRGVSLVPSDP